MSKQKYFRTTSQPSQKKRSEWKQTIQNQARRMLEEHYGKLEPLTDTLIDELVKAGWKHAELLAVRSMGYQYSRRANAFTDGKFQGNIHSTGHS